MRWVLEEEPPGHDDGVAGHHLIVDADLELFPFTVDDPDDLNLFGATPCHAAAKWDALQDGAGVLAHRVGARPLNFANQVDTLRAEDEDSVAIVEPDIFSRETAFYGNPSDTRGRGPWASRASRSITDDE